MHAIGAPFLRRQLLPDLLGRKAEHGSHGAHQCIQQAIKHRLRGPALPGFGRKGVEPIFDDIEIESAQINGGEIVERTVDLVKRELLIAFIDPLQDLRGPGQSPGVEFLQLTFLHHVVGRVKILEVRQTVSEGVAKLPVGLREVPKDIAGDHHVLSHHHGGHPETEDFRPIVLNHVFGVDHVAGGFRHCPAAGGVDDPAVRHYHPVGGFLP